MAAPFVVIGMSAASEMGFEVVSRCTGINRGLASRLLIGKSLQTHATPDLFSAAGDSSETQGDGNMILVIECLYPYIQQRSA